MLSKCNVYAIPGSFKRSCNCVARQTSCSLYTKKPLDFLQELLFYYEILLHYNTRAD